MTSSVEKNLENIETAGDSSNSKNNAGLNLNNQKDEKEKKFGCC